MSALLVGYARASTDQQDLTSQRDGLAALGWQRTGSMFTTA
jgi:DNA invertase Pin-like site-specific DNA recombinase